MADAAGTPPELLIIRTGSLELEVADIGTALAVGRDQVVALGGYVSDSEESAERDEATALVTYRIPADRWEAALDGLRGIARRVRHQRTQTEEVTGQVVDLGARIANLRASETALQAIMTQATKITEVLAVQEKLTDVRGQIERLVAEKEHLEERAAYATLHVAFLLPAAPAVEEVREGWDPATDVDRATGTLIGMGQTTTSVGIWLGIVGLPLLLVGGTGMAVGWSTFRLLRRRIASAQDGGATG